MPPKKTDDTPKSVLSTIQELKKKYPQNTNTTKTPTGILPLDYVLRGGIVAPTFVQLAGESGSGKTTCALSLAKNFVKKGQNVLYLNFEQSVIQVLAEDMGLFKYPEEQFCMLAPATIAESEDIIRKLIYATPIGETPAFQHIFFDSVGAMTPDWAEEKEVMSDDNTPAVRARQLSKFFDINNAKLKRRGVCCGFINHLTNKIAMKYGEISGMVTKGGTAVQYWTDIWVYLSKGTSLDQKDQANATGNKKFESSKYANIGTIWVEKGRSGGMMKKTECPVFFGKGISNVYWLYLVLKNEGYVKTNGSFLNCTLLDEGGVNCQGVPKLLNYLQEHQKEVISTMKKKGLWNFFDTEDTSLPEEE